MPLELYKRGEVFWFKGRIEELPNSRYYRQSTGKTSEAGAQAVLNSFQHAEVTRFYGGEETALTFAEAATLYDAEPEMAKDLLILLEHIGHEPVANISAKSVKMLAAELYPKNSTDSWLRHVITPVRTVINNAHELKKCPPIKIKGFSDNERMRQDRRRGKHSRKEKTPGSWGWINKFREVAPPHLGAMALFMFETGARISQATTITFDDFRADAGKVWMPEAKGVKAQWVPLSPELTEELSKLKPRYTRRSCGTMMLSDRLFGYLRRDGVYSTWKRVCRDAKIEQIMPHAAGRHGFGTELLVRQGLDPVTVAKAGRWTNPKMLMDRYAHAEDHNARVQAAFRTGRVQSQTNQGDKHAK